ncbi:MAG TPA: hypothetical protein PL187_18105 [Caldilinea sp.]|nr:hypothetical protein [Caldilinea sp.]
MAAPNKKTKSKSSGSPRSYSEIYKNSAATAAPIAGVSGSAAAAAAPAAVKDSATLGSDSVDWRGEYGYVVNDLKRLGLVTGIIAGGIIVVGFFV